MIPCGLELESVRAQSAPATKERYVLFVGRFHKVKDIPTLIQAFQKVRSEVPDLKLFLVGEGPQEIFLKRMVSDLHLQDGVRFLGSVERSDVFRLIHGCELLVLPSASEGCPVTLLEALAAGKIIVATKVPGTIEILNDGENGILFELGDHETLSRKIINFCTDVTLRSEMENRVRGSDLSRYEIRNVARVHAEHYLSDLDSLRICLVSASYYQDENCGGIASYYFQLNNSLLALGQNVHMITCVGSEGPKAGNEILVEPSWREMVASSMNNFGWKRLLLRFLFSYRAWRVAKQLEREQGLDIVVAPELFAQGFFLSLFQRKKLITRIHAPTVLVDAYNTRHRFARVSRILSIPEKFQARRSAALTVATNFLSGKIQSLWNISSDKIHTVQTGIDISWIRNLGIKKEKEIQGRYLLYFGRLEPLKGVEVLSKALKPVFKAVPEVRMMWIGRDWGSKDRIVSDLPGYENRMEFYDTMTKERLFPIVYHASLVILPSLFENFSNAGLEAMALERPVLATLKTGFTEMIENEVSGFLVEPGNPDAMGQKIIACLERNDLDEIGRKAYEAVARYDSKKVAVENVDFFNKIRGLNNR